MSGAEDSFMTMREVMEVTKLSRSTIYRLTAADGGFVKPKKIGKSVRFLRSEVLAWMAKQ